MKKLLGSLKNKFGVVMRELVDHELWKKVYLGSYLVELYCNDEMQKYVLAVDIAEIGEIHT